MEKSVADFFFSDDDEDSYFEVGKFFCEVELNDKRKKPEFVSGEIRL